MAFMLTSGDVFTPVHLIRNSDISIQFDQLVHLVSSAAYDGRMQSRYNMMYYQPLSLRHKSLFIKYRSIHACGMLKEIIVTILYACIASQSRQELRHSLFDMAKNQNAV